MKGDENGEYTFTGGKRCTVIDYMMGDEEVRSKGNRIRIGDRINSDHHPMEVWVEGTVERKKGQKEEKRWGRELWNEDGCELFKKKLKIEKIERKSVAEEWEEMGRRINEALSGTEKDLSKGERKKRGWWDEECKKKKRRQGKN